MSSKDSHLYNPRTHNLSNGKPISTSTTLSFTSQLSSLINTSNAAPTTKTSTRLKPKKDDLFRRPKGNAAKRAKRDDDDSSAFEQNHTTDGESLDPKIWERSKRRMEEKARLYAAMKRGDVEDGEEKYAVDFDRKWAEKHPDGSLSSDDDDDDGSGSAGDEGEVDRELVEYTDEFGRSRRGTRAEIARMQRSANARSDLSGDRFTARPSAPANVIVGDTIQHAAFNPDARVADAMDELAKKRDRSLTPPPEGHFDASKEVRRKGTGFFQFSGDQEERRRQMQGLERERAETERKRLERQEKLDERKRLVEERRRELQGKRGKRKADEFLEELGLELRDRVGASTATGTEATERIDAAIANEREDEEGGGG